MKCILLYSEDISITEISEYVQRTKFFDEDSEEKIREKVRSFKTRDRRFGRLFAIDHEVPLPEFH